MQASIENIENISLKRKPRAVSTFLKKTYQLLNEPENNTCIKWAPNGIGFIVTDEDLFSKTVLPKYFKHSNYSSFVRQLNMYNFHKIRENNSESYFHHECFDKDNKNAISQIKRKPQKKKRKGEESDSEKEENLSTSIKQRQYKDAKKPKQPKIIPHLAVSITLLKQENEELINTEKKTNGHLASETNYCPEKSMICEDKGSVKGSVLLSEKNIIEAEDDDHLSINNDITDRIPRFNTKELFYPSTHNLFPFVGNIQPSAFSLFF